MRTIAYDVIGVNVFLPSVMRILSKNRSNRCALYYSPTTRKNIITFSSLSVVFGLDSIEKTYVYSKIEVHLTSPKIQKKAKHNKPKMTIERKKKSLHSSRPSDLKLNSLAQTPFQRLKPWRSFLFGRIFENTYRNLPSFQ